MSTRNRGFFLLDLVWGLLLTALLLSAALLLIRDHLRVQRQLAVSEQLLHDADSALLIMTELVADAIPGSLRVPEPHRLSLIPAIGLAPLDPASLPALSAWLADSENDSFHLSVPGRVLLRIHPGAALELRWPASSADCGRGGLCAYLQTATAPLEPPEGRILPITRFGETEIGLGAESLAPDPWLAGRSTEAPGHRIWLFLERIEIHCPMSESETGSLRMSRNQGLAPAAVPAPADHTGILAGTVHACRFDLVDVGGSGGRMVRIRYTVEVDRQRLVVSRQFPVP